MVERTALIIGNKEAQGELTAKLQSMDEHSYRIFTNNTIKKLPQALRPQIDVAIVDTESLNGDLEEVIETIQNRDDNIATILLRKNKTFGSFKELNYLRDLGVDAFESRKIKSDDLVQLVNKHIGKKEKRRIKQLSHTIEAIGFHDYLEFVEDNEYRLHHAELVFANTYWILEQLNDKQFTELDKFRILVASKNHDYAKKFLDRTILAKTGKLTDDEKLHIRQHTVLGYEAFKLIDTMIATYIGQHHERLDGSGYPYQVSGNQLKHGSRIISIAEHFIGEISWRDYKDAKPIHTAIDTIFEDTEKGRYDAQYVDALTNVYTEHKDFFELINNNKLDQAVDKIPRRIKNYLTSA